MTRRMIKQLVLILIALVLFAIALLGAILPILPGFIFFFAGIIVLSWAFPGVRRLLHKMLHHFPRLERHIISAEKKLKKWFKA